MFCDVPGCSGMFRDVPCSWFYRRPRFASSSSSAPPSGTKNDYAVTHGKMIESSLSDYNDYETAFAIVSFKVGIVLYKTKCFSPNLIAVHLSQSLLQDENLYSFSSNFIFQRSCWSVMAISMWKVLPCLKFGSDNDIFWVVCQRLHDLSGGENFKPDDL